MRLPDKRVSHFWDGEGVLVKGYAPILKLGERPAWDVFLLFGRDVEWKTEPPTPDYWMHQLRLAPERRLDGDKLATEIEKLLTESAASNRASIIIPCCCLAFRQLNGALILVNPTKESHLFSAKKSLRTLPT